MSKITIKIDKIAGKIPTNFILSLSVRVLPSKEGSDAVLSGSKVLTTDNIWTLSVPTESKPSISFTLIAKASGFNCVEMARLTVPISWIEPVSLVSTYFPMKVLNKFLSPVYLFATFHFSPAGKSGFNVPAGKLLVEPLWPTLQDALLEKNTNQPSVPPNQFQPPNQPSTFAKQVPNQNQPANPPYPGQYCPYPMPPYPFHPQFCPYPMAFPYCYGAPPYPGSYPQFPPQQVPQQPTQPKQQVPVQPQQETSPDPPQSTQVREVSSENQPQDEDSKLEVESQTKTEEPQPSEEPQQQQQPKQNVQPQAQAQFQQQIPNPQFQYPPNMFPFLQPYPLQQMPYPQPYPSQQTPQPQPYPSQQTPQPQPYPPQQTPQPQPYPPQQTPQPQQSPQFPYPFPPYPFPFPFPYFQSPYPGNARPFFPNQSQVPQPFNDSQESVINKYPPPPCHVNLGYPPTPGYSPRLASARSTSQQPKQQSKTNKSQNKIDTSAVGFSPISSNQSGSQTNSNGYSQIEGFQFASSPLLVDSVSQKSSGESLVNESQFHSMKHLNPNKEVGSAPLTPNLSSSDVLRTDSQPPNRNTDVKWKTNQESVETNEGSNLP